MKTTKTILIAITLMILSIPTMNAQTKTENDPLKEFKLPPQTSEKVVGIVNGELDGGNAYDVYKWDKDLEYYSYDHHVDNLIYLTEEQLLENLMSAAKSKYGEEFPKFSLRSFKSSHSFRSGSDSKTNRYNRSYTYVFSAQVVVIDPKEAANVELSKAIDKAFRNVREGSRIAIDQVSVWSEINKEDYKDQVIDVLLDKGYKVVAKEYLEKLYEEQKSQQTGIYNEKTTVQENNFSAVGYYINIKVTETSLRIQVINVSSGEYEGNVTIKLTE